MIFSIFSGVGVILWIGDGIQWLQGSALATRPLSAGAVLVASSVLILSGCWYPLQRAAGKRGADSVNLLDTKASIPHLGR